MNLNDFSNQKRDAIKELKQMHKKAESSSNQNCPPKYEGSAKKAEPNISSLPKNKSNSIPFLDSFFENGDMTVIIGLLLLLMSEKADKKLLFALVYILL